TKEKLEKEKEQLNKLEENYNKVLASEQATADLVKGAIEQLEADGIDIDTLANFTKEHNEKGLQLKEEVAQLDELRSKQGQLRDQTTQLRTQIKKTELEKEEIQTQYDAQRTKHEKAEAILQDRK